MGLKVKDWVNQVEKTPNEGQLLFYPHRNLASCFLIKDCQVEYELRQSANLKLLLSSSILDSTSEDFKKFMPMSTILPQMLTAEETYVQLQKSSRPSKHSWFFAFPLALNPPDSYNWNLIEQPVFVIPMICISIDTTQSWNMQIWKPCAKKVEVAIEITSSKRVGKTLIESFTCIWWCQETVESEAE